VIDKLFFLLYNTEIVFNETKMITTNEHGQQNLFAKEPEMYVSPTDADR
jgi:hypothetical protein